MTLHKTSINSGILLCVQDREKALHNAIAAVKQYIKLKEECCGRHEAFIGVSVNGKDQHGVKTVFVDVTNEIVKIVIEDFLKFLGIRYNKVRQQIRLLLGRVVMRILLR